MKGIESDLKGLISFKSRAENLGAHCIIGSLTGDNLWREREYIPGKKKKKKQSSLSPLCPKEEEGKSNHTASVDTLFLWKVLLKNCIQYGSK